MTGDCNRGPAKAKNLFSLSMIQFDPVAVIIIIERIPLRPKKKKEDKRKKNEGKEKKQNTREISSLTP